MTNKKQIATSKYRFNPLEQPSRGLGYSVTFLFAKKANTNLYKKKRAHLLRLFFAPPGGGEGSVIQTFPYRRALLVFFGGWGFFIQGPSYLAATDAGQSSFELVPRVAHASFVRVIKRCQVVTQ